MAFLSSFICVSFYCDSCLSLPEDGHLISVCYVNSPVPPCVVSLTGRTIKFHTVHLLFEGVSRLFGILSLLSSRGLRSPAGQLLSLRWGSEIWCASWQHPNPDWSVWHAVSSISPPLKHSVRGRAAHAPQKDYVLSSENIFNIVSR